MGRRLFSEIYLYFTIILAVAMVAFGVMEVNARTPPPAPSIEKPAASALSRKPRLDHFGGHEVSLGKPAPLTIVMYYSLTCHHCHDFQRNEFPEIQKEFIDKGLVQFIFRDFPTDFLAVKAAKIAWCHGKKQYLSFARKLLATQDQWVPIDLEKLKEAEKAFEDIATKDLGIAEEDFKKCLANKDIEDAILQASFEAQRVYQINAAPSFLVNGKVYEGTITSDAIRTLLLEMGIHG